MGKCSEKSAWFSIKELQHFFQVHQKLASRIFLGTAKRATAWRRVHQGQNKLRKEKGENLQSAWRYKVGSSFERSKIGPKIDYSRQSISLQSNAA
jgi:hypothetical protein